MNKEIQKFTKEQTEIIEDTLVRVSDNTQRAMVLLNMLNHAIINIHGEFNPKIASIEVDETLKIIKELLEPVNNELIELSSNGNYFLWDSNLKDIGYKGLN